MPPAGSAAAAGAEPLETPALQVAAQAGCEDAGGARHPRDGGGGGGDAVREAPRQRGGLAATTGVDVDWGEDEDVMFASGRQARPTAGDCGTPGDGADQPSRRAEAAYLQIQNAVLRSQGAAGEIERRWSHGSIKRLK